ncbi:hypothetical protein JCM33374_g2490 [Metschnikowia sp. JCM 33374]|nr:hypothetical protein JCM33374_g2490 [Metschnikowia sp. JCM 33374]
MLPSIQTDLVEVTDTLASPCRFLYKKENQQPSGSFKLRGMSKLIAGSIEEAKAKNRSVHVYSSSGGNAGLAAAYASKYHGVPCTVVLPKTSKSAALEKLRRLDAQVVVYGAHWGEADTYLKQQVMAKVPDDVEAVYCHPFDHQTLWSGHGELVDELVIQLGDMGIAYDKVKGILSVKAGKVVSLAKIDTVSTSLAAPFVAQKTLDNYNSHPTTVDLVDDLDAVDATVGYFDTFHEVIEPACGATVALSMKRQDLLKAFGPLRADDVVIFIVCGGSTVSPETMQQYREMVAHIL